MKPTDNYILNSEPLEVSFYTKKEVPDIIYELEYLLRFTTFSKDISCCRDVYYDTSSLSFFKRKTSLRLRKYESVHTHTYFIHARFKIPNESSDTINIRKDSLFITDGKQVTSQFLTDNKLKPVVEVNKTRIKYTICQPEVQEVATFNVPDICNGPAYQYLKTKEAGLQIMIDELEHPVYGFKNIIEIEFGYKMYNRAIELIETLLTVFKGDLLLKQNNKIVDLVSEKQK